MDPGSCSLCGVTTDPCGGGGGGGGGGCLVPLIAIKANGPLVMKIMSQ